MLRVFLKKHDFDPDMLIRVMLIKKSVYFPIMNNSGKFKEILSTSFYCIIPP